MLVWRHLHVVTLLYLLGMSAFADDSRAECGKVLDDPIHGDAIYVLCPSISGLNKGDMYSVIESALAESSRPAGDIRIVFLSDPTVLERDRQYQDMEKRLASWGDAFVGMYHTNSGHLMYRSSVDGEWRNVFLGIS